jgi:hypothetical protein
MDLHAVLLKYWGYKNFRLRQEVTFLLWRILEFQPSRDFEFEQRRSVGTVQDIIRSALQGKDNMVVMVRYRFPAAALRPR